MEKQRTIQKEVSFQGVGLHTANKVNIKFKPAQPGSGINFVRTDLPSAPMIRACVEQAMPITRSLRRTSVGVDGVEVYTIEHFMAALSGLGIDNICVELDNNEIPGLDGSSLDFMEFLLKAGIQEQDKPKEYFSIKEPIFIEEEGASIVALPSQDFKISYTLSYDHPFLRSQFLELKIDSDVFKKEIASARTFCLAKESGQLQQQGIGHGASYDNTLVVGDNGVINNKLRFPDEFIRHKILDLIGDLYLLGQPIKGRIIAIKSGHSLNLRLLDRIYQQKKRYYLGAMGINYQPKEGMELDAEKIMSILPHRPPFLFVDRIIYLEKGKRAIGIKNVTVNDYFFDGHFPGKPVMPGVLIIEAMAQVGGVMMLSPQEHKGKLAFFMAADGLKFRKTVIPGDQLVFEVEAGKIKAKTGQVFGKALVNNKVVAEATLMFALVGR